QLHRIEPHRRSLHSSRRGTGTSGSLSQMLSRPPSSTLFPYTTLFRSALVEDVSARGGTLSPPLAQDLEERARDRQGVGRLADHRSEEHTSELQSLTNLVCRLLLEKKNHR